jgi:hypothetical protein
MILFDRAASAAKALALVAAMATLAGCADDVSDDGSDPSSTSGTAGDGGAGAEGGAGGAGGQGGGLGPCGEDCAAYGPPDDPCYIGVCNTGQFPGPIHVCAVVPAPKDTPCEDGLFCSDGDYCNQGACIGGPPNTCDLALEECGTITCDETTQTCSQAPADEGSACVLDGADLCQVNGKCTGGSCVGVPKDCTFSPLTECNIVACNPDNGLCEGEPDPAKEGNECALTGDLCQVAKTCQAGACLGGTPKDCSDLSVGCNNGVCNPGNGFCEAEPVPAGGACAEASDECNDGICDANAACVPMPKSDGTSCNDFSTCTDGDTCAAGVCAGDPVAGCLFYLESTFESCPENWALSGDWECGTPSNVGPSAAHGGSGVMATVIDGNYSDGNDWIDNVVADSPTINLATADEPVLAFWAWIDTEGSTYDGVNLKVSTDNGVTWTLITGVTPAYNLTIDGQQVWGGHLGASGWQRYIVPMSAYVGQQIKLRFHFRTDGSGVYPGFYVDDLVLGEAETLQLSIQNPGLGDAAVGQPYVTAMQREGGSAGAVWSVVSGTNHGWLTLDPVTGQLTGTPTAAQQGPVSITIRIEEPGLPSNFDELTADFDVVEASHLQIFEGPCPNGWTLTGDWECGPPSGGVGPAAAFSGLQCLATNLEGLYTTNHDWGTVMATSPAIDLAGLSTPVLTWRAWMHTEGNTYDGYNLKVSANGGAFILVSAVTPAYELTIDAQAAWGGNKSADGWTLYTADLSAFAGQSVQVRFDFTTDGSGEYPGVYIDDLTVNE